MPLLAFPGPVLNDAKVIEVIILSVALMQFTVWNIKIPSVTLQSTGLWEFPFFIGGKNSFHRPSDLLLP